MAAVLSSKDSSYFASPSLRRTQSRSSFAATPLTHGFPSTSGIAASYLPPSNFYAASDNSSSPPALRTESTGASYASTPDSILSISSDYDDSLPIGDASPDDDFSLPLLSQEQFHPPQTPHPTPESTPESHLALRTHAPLRLKDCDVTWLYGPLQPGSARHSSAYIESSSRALSKSESLVNFQKKPILKKKGHVRGPGIEGHSSPEHGTGKDRLLSHVSTLSGGSAKEISAPRPNRPTLPVSRRPSQSVNTYTSTNKSSNASSSTSNARTTMIDMDMDRYAQNSDSDDGVVMKKIKSKKRGPSAKRRVKKTAPAEGKTIAKLPSTTLKYREEGMDPAELGLNRGIDVYINSPRITPSLSQETLRPSKQASAFAFDADDDFDVEIASPVSDKSWSSSTLDHGSSWPSPRESVSGEHLLACDAPLPAC